MLGGSNSYVFNVLFEKFVQKFNVQTFTPGKDKEISAKLRYTMGVMDSTAYSIPMESLKWDKMGETLGGVL